MTPIKKYILILLALLLVMPSVALATTGSGSINEIITDIASVQNYLAEYEKNAHELMGLIRSLMTDNDAMYQILYIRSREVAELRHKLYGTPYEKAYTDAMKNLPIDRVPQHLHRAGDILPEGPKAPPRANQDAVDALIAELYPNIAKKRLVGQVYYAPRTMKPEAFGKALASRRDALIAEAIATSEQQNNMSRLKDQLTDINASLKQANNRYTLALKKIEDYCKRLENDVSHKDIVDLATFNKLVANYAEKVKEVELLKNTVRQQDAALANQKPAITATHERIQAIERARPNDAELAQLKAELTAYKDFLDRQEVRHAATEDAVTKTAVHVTDLSQQLAGIAKDIGKPEVPVVDLEKKALKTQTAALEIKLNATAKDLDATNSSLNNLTIQEQGMVKELEALRKTAAVVNELKDENTRLNQGVADAKARISVIAKDLEEKTALVKDLRAKAAPYEQRIAELSQEVATLSSNERCLHPVHDVNRAQDDLAASDLEKRLRRTEDALTATETRLAQAQTGMTALKEELARRDALIAELKATPQSELCSLSLDVKEKDTRINELQNQLLAVQQTIKDLNATLKTCAPAVKTP